MPSEPSLALLTIALNFLPHLGHSYMPETVTVILIFLSGNGATSSHVLYGFVTGVPHSGQRFCLVCAFGMQQPALKMFRSSFSLVLLGMFSYIWGSRIVRS